MACDHSGKEMGPSVRQGLINLDRHITCCSQSNPFGLHEHNVDTYYAILLKKKYGENLKDPAPDSGISCD